MKMEKIIDRLAERYPSIYAMNWDNPGLQVGKSSHTVKKVMIARDATDHVIQECISWEADLLVTHHPLLLSGIRNITDGNFQGRKILAMVENGIAHYAIHTNYDVLKMTELAEKALKLKKTQILEITGIRDDGSVYGIGSVGIASGKMTAGAYCEYVKKAFGLKSVRLFGSPDKDIKRVAVSPGSGKSMIGSALAANADLLVTGDIGHHDGLDAVDQGMAVIDAGHYGIEHIFVPEMAQELREAFPDLKIKEVKEREPFIVV